MDRHPIFIAHLIEFVDTHDAAVSEDLAQAAQNERRVDIDDGGGVAGVGPDEIEHE